MKTLTFLSLLLISFPLLFATHVQEGECPLHGPVNKVVKNVPDDLFKHVLLVPQYDLVPHDVPRAKEINRSVKEGNDQITQILRKNYKGKYKLVSLKDVESLAQKGEVYFLDMVVMPKQFKEPKRESMVSAYRKHQTANSMFTNYSAQFHYYFYIRNLQTDDAYISTDFKGKFLAYEAMEYFFDQVRQDTN